MTKTVPTIVTVSANEQAELSYTYQTHGLFTVMLSATDESGNEASTSVVVRIDKEVDWTQSNTDDPDSDGRPGHARLPVPRTERIVVDSTISNPAGILAGTPRP